MTLQTAYKEAIEEVMGPIYQVSHRAKEKGMRYHTVMQDLRAGHLRASMIRGAWHCTEEDWNSYVRWLWEKGQNEAA